jgi:hypothetical protein
MNTAELNQTTDHPPTERRKTPNVALDKSFSSAIGDTYGTMDVRVVVLNKRTEPVVPEVEMPLDAGEDEVFLADTTRSPLSGYLEDPKRGKECIVFLVNGQRQEAWDNTFIQRDLGFKYLRNRTMIIVTLDGLKPEALADIMQGSREHFYPGTVHGAIVGRLTATLRKDPDLEALEAEAERQISELRAGDSVVKAALDQLIEDHHTLGDHTSLGAGGNGATGGDGGGFGVNRTQSVIVDPLSNRGTPTEGAYLYGDHAAEKIRLVPDEQFLLTIRAMPEGAFATIEALDVSVLPRTDGLAIEQAREPDALKTRLKFSEPEDFDPDGYPIDATLRVIARFKNMPEPRLFERKIVIAPRKKRPDPRPITLLPVPSFLKVVSRQPVRLVRGAADTHVRLKWDGEDSLAIGNPPAWTFQCTCRTLRSLGATTFTRPNNGRFEVLVPTPASLSAGSVLDFDVEANGPGGAKLSVQFSGEVVDPPAAPTPKKRATKVPEPAANRRPPYRLVYIKEDQFDSPLWDEDIPWTFNDPGCFHEPTEAEPLTLVINEDFAPLEEFRKSITTGPRKLDPATVERRVTRYTSHVAFHLYQMYLYSRAREEAAKRDSSIPVPGTEDKKGEIGRVSATLLKMMQVAV